MDRIRAYASLTRTLAQTVSIDVTRSRFLREAPDLSLVEQDGDE